MRDLTLFRILAFTRSPETGSPATYTGTSAIDTLILADQASSINISGLGANDNIVVSGAALAASALTDFKVYGNAGDDTITVNAAQLSLSTVQGGAGDDRVSFTGTANALASVIRGGADDDTIAIGSSNQSTVNGNLGSDTLTITGNTFNSRIYGGAANDTININGAVATGTRFNGSKGADTLNVNAAANITNASVFGGEGADAITVAATNASTVYLSGDKGNDVITATGLTVGGSVFGGEGNDTVNVSGAAAADTFAIDTSVGADSVTVGVGTDTITFDRGDSVASTATSFNNANTVDTNTIVTFGDGVDIITGAATTIDEIDIDMAVPAAFTALNAVARTTVLGAGVIGNATGTIVGNQFTFLGAGQDQLIIVGGGGLTIEQNLASSTNIFLVEAGAGNAADLVIGDFV